MDAAIPEPYYSGEISRQRRNFRVDSLSLNFCEAAEPLLDRSRRI